MKKILTLLLALMGLTTFSIAQYCASNATSTVDDDIGQVIIGSLVNPTVAPSPLTNNPLSSNTYTDFTGTVTPPNYAPGLTYPLTITQINSSPFFYNCGVGIWIDLDQSGIFDPAELLFFGSTGTANPLSGSLTIPPGSPTGQTTMRIVLWEGATATSIQPCGTYTWGETEDYLVNILPPAPNDMGISQILNLGSGCGLSATTPIDVVITNYGTNTQTNPTVSYSIDGGIPVTEIATMSLIANGSAPYTFTATANLSVVGPHVVEAWTSLPGDAYPFNDNSIVNVQTIQTINTYPYLEPFTTGNGGWISGGAANSWGLGSPTSTVINYPYSAPSCWKTNLTGNNNSSEQSYVEGPCFDFTNLNAPVFESAVWWNSESGWDGAVLLSSIDGGLTWQLVGQYLDPNNWYNETGLNSTPGTAASNINADGWAGNTSNNGSGTWKMAKHDLVGLQNQPSVKLRIAFSSDFSINYDGFAFDNVHIYEKPPFDFGVTSVVSPVINFCTAPTTPFIMAVSNLGSQPQSNVPVVLTVTDPLGGVSTYNTVMPGPLAVGATTTVTFPSVATNLPGVYTFYSYTNDPSDPNNTNDTTYSYIKIAVTPDMPISTDIVICDSASVTFDVTNPVPGGIYYWYDAIGGNNVGIGTSYTTPVVNATTNYYVEAKSLIEYNVGKKTKLGNGFNTSFPNNNGLLFDVFAPITIDSVTIFPGGAGDLTFFVFDPTGIQIFQATQTFNAPTYPGGPVKIPVGVAIQNAGTGYSMRCSSTLSSLFYNYSGAIYPYTDPSNSISITSTTTGSLTYYYYFYDWTVSVLGCSSGFDTATVLLSIPPLPNLGSDAITCAGYPLNGTTATAVSYLWNTNPPLYTPNINVSTSGQYVIAATNQYGCTGTDTVNITVLPTPAVNLGPDISSCALSTTLSTGTQPVGTSYLWSSLANYANTPTVTITQSGTYSVNVTGSTGCVGTDSITVQLNGVDVNLGPDVASCNPSVVLNAGNPGTTYSWYSASGSLGNSQMLSVTQAGTYYVVVSSNGCSDVDDINITFGTAPTVNLGPDQTVCNGTTLSAGNTGANYSWSNGQVGQSISVNQTGTYAVSVNYVGGCTTIDQVNITVYTPPVASFVVQSSNPNTGFFQFNANASAGSLPLIFNWNFGDGTTSNVQNPQHTYQVAGIYTITLIVNNPVCGNDTMTTTVESNFTNGIENSLSIKDLQIFPNPNQGVFTISSMSLEADDLRIEVLDLQGKELYRKDMGKVNGFTHNVNIEKLAQGVYFVKVSDGVRSTYSKVIVE